jgi:SAM-dependent methyltransferase
MKAKPAPSRSTPEVMDSGRHATLKRAVQSFWNARPCGSKFARYEPGTREFFLAVEQHRYLSEPHIVEMAAFSEARGKRVLEIGCGLGTDAVQFVHAGADYFGIDLSPVSVGWAKRNLALRNLRAEWLVCDAESLPFPADTFDLVYSSGVLHHTPDFAASVAEIHRVLRPGGRAIVMIYHKNSFNYYVSILFLRRLGALLLRSDLGVRLAVRLSGGDIEHLRSHSERLKEQKWSYLRGPVWLNNNTDGVGNPLSCVFSRSEMRRFFARFSQVRIETRFLHAESIPGFRRLLGQKLKQILGRRWGWHLYVIARK